MGFGGAGRRIHKCNTLSHPGVEKSIKIINGKISKWEEKGRDIG